MMVDQNINQLKFGYELLNARLSDNTLGIDMSKLKNLLLDAYMSELTEEFLELILSALGIKNYIVINPSSIYILTSSISEPVKEILDSLNIKVYHRFFADHLIGGSMNVEQYPM